MINEDLLNEAAESTRATDSTKPVVINTDFGPIEIPYDQLRRDLASELSRGMARHVADEARRQGDDDEVEFAFTTAQDRRARPSFRWLIDNLVPLAPSVGVLFGPRETYKSFLVAHLVMSLTNGAANWLGQEIAPDPEERTRHGLIVLMEGAEAYQQRLDALTAAYPGWTDDGVITLENQPVDLSSPRYMGAMARGMRNVKIGDQPFRPAIVVVDTQGLAMGETDEYNRPAMRQVYKLTRLLAVEFGCFVLLVTHPGNTNQHRPAGSSTQLQDVDLALRAYGDGSVEVVKCKDGNARGRKFHHRPEPFGGSLAVRWLGDQSISEQQRRCEAERRARDNEIVAAVRTLQDEKPTGVSKSDVHTKVKGNRDEVLKAIDRLLTEGRLTNRCERPNCFKLETDENEAATN